MINVAVAPIVEGHGEVESVRILLTRVSQALGLPCVLQVLTPIRMSKSKMVRDEKELLRAVKLAALKLEPVNADRKFVLLLLDADEDPACQLAPRLLSVVARGRGDLDVSCVLPVTEYESWLVGGADTLSAFLKNGFAAHIPPDPEAVKAGKGWIQHFFAGPKYSETADQARLTSAFDITKARQRSRSFGKLCRELEKRCS
jgi:hypothetical protein